MAKSIMWAMLLSALLVSSSVSAAHPIDQEDVDALVEGPPACGAPPVLPPTSEQISTTFQELRAIRDGKPFDFLTDDQVREIMALDHPRARNVLGHVPQEQIDRARAGGAAPAPPMSDTVHTLLYGYDPVHGRHECHTDPPVPSEEELAQDRERAREWAKCVLEHLGRTQATADDAARLISNACKVLAR